MKKKIVILGDSISEGIGKKMINYEMFLKEKFRNQYEFYNLAHTGTTIEYANKIYTQINHIKPELVIIFYGNVDAQIRANINGKKTKIIKFIPKRYQHNGMLDPRPFYSKKWYRFLPDRFDNFFRKILKTIVILCEGTTQWFPIEKFKEEYEKLIKHLIKDNIEPIIVSTTYLDDKKFLNSNLEYYKYNEILKKMAKKYGCKYIDLYNGLKYEVENNGFRFLYSYDNFHPNENGYKYIANLISRNID